ncbi:MAG: hypothetical protein J2P31_05835 [Blastocatellia bacterium]|nr:hypothetical protein [Blastocatellia bacterium]
MSAPADKLLVKLRMPAGYRGKVVPSSIVMMELLWQQYGLDIIHPQVNRWIEKNAPDLKYMAASMAVNNQFSGNKFRADLNGIVNLQLSLNLDDRLREVSSSYIRSQVETSIEPETGLRLVA